MLPISFSHISNFQGESKSRTSSTSRGSRKPNPEGMDSHISRPLDRTLPIESLSSFKDVTQRVPLGGSDEPKVSEAEDGGDEGDDVEERRSREVRTRSKVVPQGEVENLEMRGKQARVSSKLGNDICAVENYKKVGDELGRALNEKEEEGRELTRHELPSLFPSFPEVFSNRDKLPDVPKLTR